MVFQLRIIWNILPIPVKDVLTLANSIRIRKPLVGMLDVWVSVLLPASVLVPLLVSADVLTMNLRIRVIIELVKVEVVSPDVPSTALENVKVSVKVCVLIPVIMPANSFAVTTVPGNVTPLADLVVPMDVRMTAKTLVYIMQMQLPVKVDAQLLASMTVMQTAWVLDAVLSVVQILLVLAVTTAESVVKELLVLPSVRMHVLLLVLPVSILVDSNVVLVVLFALLDVRKFVTSPVVQTVNTTALPTVSMTVVKNAVDALISATPVLVCALVSVLSSVRMVVPTVPMNALGGVMSLVVQDVHPIVAIVALVLVLDPARRFSPVIPR